MPCACCCSQCNSPEPDCCGGEYPRLVGVCCEGVWRIGGGVCCDGTWRTGEGECCGGVWETGSGECCDGVWQTETGGCCDGVWYSGEGYCCNGTWHSDADPDAPCEEGWTFHRWGESLACCGCVPPELFDPELNGGRETTEDVLAALCCPTCDVLTLRNEYDECPGQCCDGAGNCTPTVQSSCTDEGYTWSPACCSDGCPVACCTEDSAGNVECEVTNSTLCVGYAADTCESGCLGECCVDGVSTGQTTQEDCFSAGGLWGGLGSTACPGEGDCRSPFSENCCETKQSSGAGLIFIQPYNKRTPAFQGTLRATVTGTTDSPIRVHGVSVGQPGKRCPFTVTFPLCRDRFEIEPIPCGSTFHRVNVTVCWEEVETTTETLNFSACNGLAVRLSDCDLGCVTTLVYSGSGATTNANLTLYGDAVIDARGGGALVLTSNIAHAGSCSRTLTLAGTSTHANEVRQINSLPGAGECSVVKDDVGTWRLNAAKAFDGTLTVKNGTLLVAASGAAGSTVAIGDTAVGRGGVAAFLLEQNQSASPDFDVLTSAGTQEVWVGGANTAGVATFASGEIRMSRDITLVAADNGSVFFDNITWAGASPGSPADRNVRFGAAGYAGAVKLNPVGTLETAGEIVLAYGSVDLSVDTTLAAAGGLSLLDGTSLRVRGTLYGGIDPATRVSAATATLTLQEDPGDPAVAQSLDDLVVTGTLTVTGGGDLTASDLSGSGGIALAAGTLNLSAVTMTGTLSVSGGTANLSQFVSNPGSLATSASLTSSTLTVAFSGTPSSGQQYVLLPGATSSPTSVVLTGTSATGTYSASTSTLTID